MGLCLISYTVSVMVHVVNPSNRVISIHHIALPWVCTGHCLVYTLSVLFYDVTT